jgi:hypothetical protein
MKFKLGLVALSILLACATAPAQAIGRLADVTVLDRDSGATLPIHYHRGEYWVAGRPGARYAISVRSKVGERVLAVTSIDGVNVLSGETAAWGQTGYVFSPYMHYQITGWRKSSSEVAAFEFANANDSYAERTGRPAQVGVIGVALFRESPPEPVASQPQYLRRDELGGEPLSERARREAGPAPSTPEPSEKNAGSLAGLADQSNAESAAAAPGGAHAYRQSLAKARSAPFSTPKLGTGHGQREGSTVSHTSFTRLQSQPNEIIRLRYDSRANLIAGGVIREPVDRAPIPNPFPESDSASYVPDPPVRRY